MREHHAAAAGVALSVVAAVVAGCHSAAALPAQPAPAAAPTPPRQRALPDALWTRETTSRSGMVVASSPEAAAAGAEMLERGGNAIDAAVAATFALTVASPGLAGIFGQTYILLHLADGRDVAIDGSCRAPLAVRAEQMKGLADQLGFSYGWKTVATPGSLAALAAALERFGTMTLAETIAPAVGLAEYGTGLPRGTRVFFQKYFWTLLDSPSVSALYLKNGIEPFPPDHLLCNPDLACFLRRVAAGGADEFYRGAIAAEIEADMTANGGWVRRADLARLRAEIRQPVRGRYRGFDVLSFPLPGNGAAVVEALGILDRFPPELLREDTPDRLHLLVEACRLAHADSRPAGRPSLLPDRVATDPGHVAARAALIRFDRALAVGELSRGPLSTVRVDGTTQVSVVDSAGNVVSLTHTLGNAFGAEVATPGFGTPYNNLGSGFNFTDPRHWQYVRPLEAPLTGMAPTILLREGKPYLAIGSAGSDKILAIIVNVVSNLVDRGMPPCEAMTAARVVWGGFPEDAVYLEMIEPVTDDQADVLRRRGFAEQHRQYFPGDPLSIALLGGANAVLVDPHDGTLIGVGDPRRSGTPVAPRPTAAGTERLVPPACWRDLYAAPASPGQPAGSTILSGAGAATADPGRVRFVGRVEAGPAGEARCAWPGTGFVTRFQGTGVAVRLRDDRNRHQAVLDGRPLAPIVTTGGVERYVVAKGLAPGEHTLEVYRRTEALFGVTTFLGVEVEGGRLLDPGPAPARRIEVVGDSISCGYGNEGTTPDCRFSPDTENHWASYGSVLSRALGAELSTVAWSGRGVVRNWAGGPGDHMGRLYGRTLPESPASVWPQRESNDAVIVNLGTNDFSTEPDPDEEAFARGYAALLEQIRRGNPRAFILCTVGPMLGDADRERAESAIARAVADSRSGGDEQVAFHRLTTRNEHPGCDWHPGIATHRRMAEELAVRLKAALGW